MKAIKAALDPSDARDHVRIVCFMTDGYVGNDMEIISEVQKHPNARVFSFGIGGSVNRFLLDKMAEHGRGEVEYVSLNEDGSAAARRFHERVRNPLLTDITVDWGGLPVADVYPKAIPDLFGAKPVVLTGRFAGPGRGVIRLRGRMGGNAFEREIAVTFPESQAEHEVLATLWARRRVEDLMSEDYAGAQSGRMRDDLREAVTNLGLEYGLMTQFTSFVAVEEMTVTDGGEPRRVEVPVELPEGVSPLAVSREYSNFTLLSSGGTAMASASEMVTVTSDRPMIDTTQPGGTFKYDRSVIDPGSVLEGDGARLRGRRKEKKPTPEEKAAQAKAEAEAKARQLLAERLHPSLVALVERLKNADAKPGADESKFVRDGKAEVQIWLAEKTPEVLARLKQLGFELTLEPQSASLVVGRVPLESLAALAELDAVRYVSPRQ
jgi:Ca-activated chloride channel family protein